MILKGIRVLDLSRVIAGPYGAQILADLGAEVIKIETPGGGDDSRNTYPKKDDEVSAFYAAYNLGKRSITLNLKRPEAKEAFYRLVKTADVVIENFRTGVAEKLGVGYEQLKEIKPDLIYCSVCGYSRTGPYRYKGGYDMIAQAQFGMMSITGNGRDDEPVRTAYSVNDVGTGINTAFGIVCALIHRQQTGEGQRLEGIAASEAGNNGVTGSTLIPLLTLGIRFFYKITEVPKAILQPIILALCCIGTYASSTRQYELILMLVISLVAYLMKKADIPTTPTLLALILGPTMERSLRSGLIASRGSVTAFLFRPITAIILSVAVLLLVVTVVLELKNTRQK